MITTVLGSCIAICAYDEELKLGGMNHFMLPGELQVDPARCRRQQFNERLRYGKSAIDTLLSDLLRFGARKENMVVKVFGGAKMFGENGLVGQQNVETANRYLRELGYNVAAQDTGLNCARKVNFFCDSGRILVKRIQSLKNNTLNERETSYAQNRYARRPGKR